MTRHELEEEIRVQLDLMRQTVNEIVFARASRAGDPLQAFDLAGFGALLMNFYSGIENILKRIAVFHGIEIPTGPNWHVELLSMFVSPTPSSGAPRVFSQEDAELLREYRSFRHLMVHGYGVALRWEKMSHLVDGIETAMSTVVAAVDRYLSPT